MVVLLANPVWQVSVIALVFATLAVLLLLRTSWPGAQRLFPRIAIAVLVASLLSCGLLSGTIGWTMTRGNAATPASSGQAASPSPTPTPTPALQPTPTATPHLALSITQRLTAFCAAFAAHAYFTAWQYYAPSLQRAHPYAQVSAAWSKYQNCSVADAGDDPDAIRDLDLTLLPGQKDQFGYTGDLFYTFTMGVDHHVWKITHVCRGIAEGCFSVFWG